MSRACRVALVAALALAGCARGPTNVVDLTIVADANVTGAMLSSARTLTIAISGVHSNMKSYTLPATGLPKQESVQLLPTVTSGMLDVTVTALDKNKVPVAQGMKSVALTGKEVALSITLSLVAPPTVTVTPAMGKVTVGKTIAFSANLPVKWSVMGGAAAGSIDADGNYTAPLTPGMYTISATAVSDPDAGATAKVQAVDYGVELLIAQPGGAGELDGVGGAARFSDPYAIAFDGNNRLFVGDRGGCTVRTIDLPSYTVTTIGGLGGICTGADGMLGTTATFGNVLSLVYDAASNTLFVSDSVALRRVDLTAKTVQSLSDPSSFPTNNITGMVYDATQKLIYGSRKAGHFIIKVDLSGAAPVVTRFAGTPQTPGSGDTATGPATLAQFNLPTGLAFDGTNLYVADQGNNEIRQIVVASGITTTLAGKVGPGGDVNGAQGTGTLNSPFGLALRPGMLLYVSEEVGNVVRVVALANGSLSTLAGVPYVPPAAGMPVTPQLPADGNGTTALFGSLAGIAFDGATMVYALDQNNHVVRGISAFGTSAVQTVAGTPAQLGAADGPGAAARFWNIGTMYTAGHVVYISDNGNATVRKYDYDTNTLSTIAGSAGLLGNSDGVGAAARFQRPEGLFVDGNTLYISDGSDSTIRSMDLTTNQVTTLAGSHQSVGTSDGIGTSARFGYPFYVTGDHAGHLYISDADYFAIRKLDLGTNAVTTPAGNSTTQGIMDGVGSAALFQFPYGLAIDGGVLYVADTNTIRSVTLDTFKVTTVVGGTSAIASLDGFGTNAHVVSVSALAGDGAGHIFFGDLGLLRRYDIADTKVSTLIGKQYQETDQAGPLASALVAGVSGIAFAPGGDLLFEDSAQSLVMLVRAPPAP